jgi:hypothetical protein
VSSPGESHPEALVEPYVSLSTHTAPIGALPLNRRLAAARTSDPTAKREQSLQRELTHVGKGIERDFSPPIRKDSCRLSSCANVCLHCVIANRHSVLSCRRSLTAPMIAPHSYASQRLSQHSLLAGAERRKRLVSLNGRKSCDSWLKTFWLARIPSPFVTAFRSPRVRPKTEDPRLKRSKLPFV